MEFKGLSHERQAVLPRPKNGFLTLNFLLQHHAFLHKGLFCERPMNLKVKSGEKEQKKIASCFESDLPKELGMLQQTSDSNILKEKKTFCFRQLDFSCGRFACFLIETQIVDDN